MNRPIIAVRRTFLALVLLAGCASPRTTPGEAQAPATRDGASGAAGQSRTDQAAALKAVEELEAAVSAARTAVDSASAGAETATADQRVRLSDTRRAIVGANVALQKAREALGRGDFAGASQATLGMAEHLKGILAKLRG